MIPRSTKRIRPRRKVKLKSLRFEVIDGTYKLYPDKREICLDNAKGQAEYRRRTVEMAMRQRGICGLAESGNCLYPSGTHMSLIPGYPQSATFEHWNKRSAGKRTDSISPETRNCAAHGLCNGALGSRRIE